VIPTKATDAEHEAYVSNILTAWYDASEEDEATGRAWYQVAHDLANILGDGDTRKGAGVIAALSPQQGWERNCKLAEAAFAGHLSGTVGNALAKTRMILEGRDPADVLPYLRKTGNFYRNILDPTDPDPVTIDRHAHDVAVGEVYGSRDRGLGCASRYATLAHAYREAARRLGELPCTVQAVTWVAHRRRISGTSKRGNLNSHP
jgi:hypothetical protein